ncbi:MAG: hypothetical protein MZV63_36520 [Marinilabiliales bacterium]|nr:hypothetical protein [Marinilabiliales bacterium]
MELVKAGYGESIGRMISTERLKVPDLSVLYSESADKIRTDPDIAAAAADLAGAIKKFNLQPGIMSVPHPFRKYSVSGQRL